MTNPHCLTEALRHAERGHYRLLRCHQCMLNFAGNDPLLKEVTQALEDAISRISAVVTALDAIRSRARSVTKKEPP